MIQTRKFTGNIDPVEITTNTQGNYQNLIDLIDWEKIFNKHLPPNAQNPELSIKLELFQLNYVLPSLLKVPAANYPYIDEAIDTKLDIQAKTQEFKRKYNINSGHAIKLILYEVWTGVSDALREAAFAEEYLYNLGQWGYLNVLDPYLIKDSEVFLGDKDRKISLLIEGDLNQGDRLVFRGAYSGEIEYEEGIEDIQENSDERDISTSPINVLNNRPSRIGLYVCNVGIEPVSYRFKQSASGFQANRSPQLEPGQSLTIEHGKLIVPSEHPAILKNLLPYWIKMPLYMATVRGESRVVFQEFYF